MSPLPARPFRLASPALFLGVALLPAALLPIGASVPAAAQVMIYEGPYGAPPAYGYEVPARVPRYPILPPREVMNIVRGMGYWQVSLPRLAGGTYVLTAVDEEGPAVLRVNAATGRVVSARTLNGAQTIAVPGAPRRSAAPPAPPRNAAPPVARLAPSPQPSAAPLPPPRPPEASMAALTPAPAAPAAPGAVAPAAPAAVAPGATPPAQQSTGPVPPASAVPPPAPIQAPAQPPAAPSGASAEAPSPGAAGKAPDAPAGVSQAGQGPRKAGVGTAASGSASAGTASVLSKPKGAN